MKDLDPTVFVAVFQEMLGPIFWPLIVFIVLGALALLVVLVRDRGLDSRRFVRAELVGIVGGFLGIWFMLAVTGSRITDIGGPIDWILVIGIWAAGAIGATITAYVLMGIVGGSARKTAS